MKIRAALLLTFFTAACAHNTAVRESPEFAAASGKTYSVAILPPAAEIKYIQFDSGDKRMSEAEAKAVEVINAELPKLLADRNYQVRDMKFDEYKAKHEEAPFELEKLKEQVKRAMDEMYKTNMLPEKQAFNIHESVGADVNLFADLSHSDLVLYVDYKGYEKSDAKATKDIAAGVLLAAVGGGGAMTASAAGQISAALIDGTTGDILWATRALTEHPLNNYDGTGENPLAKPFAGLPDKSGSKSGD